jgi:hypothetical protein
MPPSHKRIPLRSFLNCVTVAATLVAGWPPRLFNPLHDTGYEQSYFRGPSTESWRQVDSLKMATSPRRKHFVGGTVARNSRCRHFSYWKNTGAAEPWNFNRSPTVPAYTTYWKILLIPDVCHKIEVLPTENTTLANSESYPDIRQPSVWVSLQAELTFFTQPKYSNAKFNRQSRQSVTPTESNSRHLGSSRHTFLFDYRNRFDGKLQIMGQTFHQKLSADINYVYYNR